MINSVANTAVNGISAAFSSAADNAAKITRFEGSASDLVQSIVGLITAGQQVRADASVIRTDDQTQQSLLNILA